MTVIKQEHLIQSVADALQYISYYHPRDFIQHLGRAFERSLIQKALSRTGGRRIEAATLLGMGRNTITRKIQELGIEEPARD